MPGFPWSNTGMRLQPALPSKEAVVRMGRLASTRSSPLPDLSQIDTGMGRLGLSPADARSLLHDGWPSSLQLEGLMSHLGSADDGDPKATESQLTDSGRSSRTYRDAAGPPRSLISQEAPVSLHARKVISTWCVPVSCCTAMRPV